MKTGKNAARLARLAGSLLLAAAGWMAGGAPALAAPVTITGTAGPAGATTVSPNIQVGTNTNFTNCNAGPWNYRLFTFTVDTTGTYTASVVTPTTLNTTFFLQGTYDPSTTPCAPSVLSRFLVSVLASGSPNTSTFNGTGLTLQAGVLYSVLIAFNTPHVGSQPFTLTMNGPGCIAIGGNPCNAAADAEVIGLVTAQVEAAKRFAAAQGANFQVRMESLHRRKSAPAQTGASASGETREVAQARDALGAGSAGMGGGMGADAGAGSTGTGNPMAAGPLAAQDAKAPGSGLPGSGMSLNGTLQNVVGTGVDIWSGGVVNLGSQGNIDARFTTAGISVGTDKRVSDKLALGIGGGFAHDRQEVGDNGTHNTGDSYSLSLYGSYEPADGFFIDGLLGYGHLRFDARRYVTANGAIATSSRTGSQWFASLAGGYDHEFEYGGRKMLLSPYGRLDLVRTRLNQATEDGGALFNLEYSAQDVPTTSFALGARGEVTLPLRSGAVARPYFRVEYLYDFDRAGVAQMRFANQQSGTVYQIDSVTTTRDTARLGLGSRYQFRNGGALDLYYQFSNTSSTDTQVHTFAATLSRLF